MHEKNHLNGINKPKAKYLNKYITVTFNNNVVSSKILGYTVKHSNQMEKSSEEQTEYKIESVLRKNIFILKEQMSQWLKNCNNSGILEYKTK